MKGTFNIKPLLLAFYIALVVSMVFLPMVVADNHESDTETESSEAASDQEVVELEGLVIVGTRAKPRSVLEIYCADLCCP